MRSRTGGRRSLGAGPTDRPASRGGKPPVSRHHLPQESDTEARSKLLGHPIHQMLIVLPLGLLVGAIIFDLAHLLSEGGQWAMISYWLIPAGVLSGLLAALFGFTDWTKIPSGTRAKRVGLLHGGGNVFVVFSSPGAGCCAADPTRNREGSSSCSPSRVAGFPCSPDGLEGSW